MKNKSIILGLSFLFSLILFLIKYTVFSIFLKDILGRQWLEITFNTLFFMPIIFFFSLLTYKLPNKVFTYWWKFARLAIPMVFILVILINLRLHHTPGGWMNLDNEIDLLMTYLIYGLFILGSFIQIVRGFWSKNPLNRRGTLR